MKKLNTLKINKRGNTYLEIDAEILLHLEWSIGDKILIEVTDPWMYDRTTKTCTLTNITQERFDALIDAFKGIEEKNTAPNREPPADT